MFHCTLERKMAAMKALTSEHQMKTLAFRLTTTVWPDGPFSLIAMGKKSDNLYYQNQAKPPKFACFEVRGLLFQNVLKLATTT